ncbi:MAG: hypothetical protein U5K69_18895 [Balneolaceae bacterium]|nr:hypothetical protein [Balneolaceae bacterium]
MSEQRPCPLERNAVESKDLPGIARTWLRDNPSDPTRACWLEIRSTAASSHCCAGLRSV